MLAPQGPTKQNTRLYLWYHRTDKRGCLRLGKALGTGHEDSLLGDTPGAGILVATPCDSWSLTSAANVAVSASWGSS